MNSLSPTPDPRRQASTTGRTQHPTHQIELVNRTRSFRDSSMSGAAKSSEMDKCDRPTVPAKASFDELVRCAFEAKAVSFDQASVAVKTGLLTQEQLALAEARFFDRFGYQHFAAQLRGAL